MHQNGGGSDWIDDRDEIPADGISDALMYDWFALSPGYG
jgi:hypothetical protein